MYALHVCVHPVQLPDVKWFGSLTFQMCGCIMCAHMGQKCYWLSCWIVLILVFRPSTWLASRGGVSGVHVGYACMSRPTMIRCDQLISPWHSCKCDTWLWTYTSRSMLWTAWVHGGKHIRILSRVGLSTVVQLKADRVFCVGKPLGKDPIRQ